MENKSGLYYYIPTEEYDMKMFQIKKFRQVYDVMTCHLLLMICVC